MLRAVKQIIFNVQQMLIYICIYSHTISMLSKRICSFMAGLLAVTVYQNFDI